LRAWQQALGTAMPEAHWLDLPAARARPERVDAAVVANPAPGSLQGLSRLRLIQSLWAGVDRLLADPTLPAAVPLARMVDPALNRAMAETALWATLSVQRGFFDYARQQRQARWLQHAQRSAADVRVLVLGLGQMGRTTALLLAAQGFAVTGWARHPGPDLQRVQRIVGDAGLQAALPGAEVLINLLPLTPSTEGLLNARLFSALPRGAAVVNLARGAHLVQADLLAALGAGHLRHAVLDVFDSEPLPPQHPFWRHERVTVLPHVAALTDARSAAAVVAANLRALQSGQPLQHLVQRARGY
jgi:glyoxylate/hydroxypyruvate reductase A